MKNNMFKDDKLHSSTEQSNNLFSDFDWVPPLPLFYPKADPEDFSLPPFERTNESQNSQSASPPKLQFETEEEPQQSVNALPRRTVGKFEKRNQKSRKYERPNKSNIIFKLPLSLFRKKSTFIPVFNRNKHLEKFQGHINDLLTSKANKRTFPIVVCCFKQLGIVQVIAQVWEEQLPCYLETQKRQHGSSPIFNEIHETCIAMSGALRQQTTEGITTAYWRSTKRLANGIDQVHTNVKKFQNFMVKMGMAIVEQ